VSAAHGLYLDRWFAVMYDVVGAIERDEAVPPELLAAAAAFGIDAGGIRYAVGTYRTTDRRSLVVQLGADGEVSGIRYPFAIAQT
jgi:hypothetical protein